jgi:acyl carrier protein
MTVIEKLNSIFHYVFEDDSIRITQKTTANDIDAWDSLSHVNLIVAIETMFKVKFTQKELVSFKNVGDLVQSIESKIS